MSLMHILVAVFVVAIVGGLIALALVAVKRKQVESELHQLQNPPPMHCSLPVGESLRLVRGVLKNQSFLGKRWTIKEDNPNGMIIALMTFDENLAAGDGLAKRQLILTVSSVMENDLTKVMLLYSVYSTFGMKTADSILRQTTDAIGKEVLAA